MRRVQVDSPLEHHRNRYTVPWRSFGETSTYSPARTLPGVTRLRPLAEFEAAAGETPYGVAA